jgi:putative ABC transport system permease protein
MLNDLFFRLRALFRRRDVEQELDQELRFHFENEVEKHKRAGATEEEATRLARLSFGGQDQIKEDCREARGTSLLEASLQDVRYSLRLLCKNPSFSIIAALTLALGIGPTTAIFSLVDTILLKPLPYPNAGRVAMLWRSAPLPLLAGNDNLPWDSQDFRLLTERSTVFQNLGAFRKDSFNLTGVPDPELLEGVRASAGFFPALGAPPILGRTFTAQDDQPGHDHVVVLGNRLWKSRFGGNPRVVGSNIELNGYQYRVIGIMPGDFAFPRTEGMPRLLGLPKETQLWVPLALTPGPQGSAELGVIAEPRPGISPAQVRQEMDTFDQGLAAQFFRDKAWFSRIVPLAQQTVTGTRRPLLLLLGAVLVVLLIACSNVAGLMLNRSLERRREFTLRGALGASRGRLVRQLMTESMLLALAGGVMGILLGELGLSLVKHFGPSTIPHLRDTRLDVRVIVFTFATTLVTGILFGLAPAFGATRMNTVDALKGGGQRSGRSVAASRIRNALLIAQVALGLVLVIASGLLLESFLNMVHADPGFDAAHVVVFDLPLPPKYDNAGQIAQLFNQVLRRLQSVPEVESAGFASVLPMGGEPDQAMIQIPEQPTVNGNGRLVANYSFVSPGYFKTIGAFLLHGRDISDRDTQGSEPVAIINSAMAKKYWPAANPIGKQIGVPLPGIPLRTIVGVVGDIKQVSLREEPGPKVFVPYTQDENIVEFPMQSMEYAIRTRGDSSSIAEIVRHAVRAADAGLPIARYGKLEALVDASTVTGRFLVLLVAAFGVLALLLASIGMYGVISYSVMHRTPEIGLRIALGAGRSQILVFILGQGIRIVSFGIALGLIAAFATTRLMTRFLYGVQPVDPITFAAVSLLQVAVVLLACYVPARKAMKVDPVIALRYE